MKQIEVVAAIIHDSEGRIFATQRGYGEYKDWLPADWEVVKKIRRMYDAAAANGFTSFAEV